MYAVLYNEKNSEKKKHIVSVCVCKIKYKRCKDNRKYPWIEEVWLKIKAKKLVRFLKLNEKFDSCSSSFIHSYIFVVYIIIFRFHFSSIVIWLHKDESDFGILKVSLWKLLLFVIVSVDESLCEGLHIYFFFRFKICILYFIFFVNFKLWIRFFFVRNFAFCYYVAWIVIWAGLYSF